MPPKKGNQTKKKQSDSSDEDETPTKKRDIKSNAKCASFFDKKYHEMNEKNDDYFTCPKQNDTLTTMRNKTFPDIFDMKKEIQKLNKDFGCQDESTNVVGMVCNM